MTRILFDQGVPGPLRRHLIEHNVETTGERGWSQLSNGDLLAAADRAGFEVMITTDQNLRHQQNLSEHGIGIIVLMTTSWPRMREHIGLVTDALQRCRPADIWRSDFSQPSI